MKPKLPPCSLEKKLKSLHQNIPEAKKQLHTVLLIRGDHGICDYASLDLQKNVEFIEAENLEEGLQILKKDDYKFSTIIVDLDSEDLEIVNFLQKIQRNLNWNYIPTLVSTDEDQDERLAQHLDAGAYHYLSKNSDVNLVKSIIKKAIKDYTTYTFYLSKAVNKNISSLVTKGPI